MQSFRTLNVKIIGLKSDYFRIEINRALYLLPPPLWLKSDYFRIEIVSAGLMLCYGIYGSNQTILGLKLSGCSVNSFYPCRLKSDYFRIEITGS